MQLADGHYYAIDTTDVPAIATGQPPSGFATRVDATAWAAKNLGDWDWEVRQYASFFAREAHIDGVIEGVRTISEAVADNQLERMSSPFEAMPVDRRAARLGLDIECARFAQPDGHEGEYARIVIRLPTGDGLVVLPRPDGTLVLDWEFPGKDPREERLCLTGYEPDDLLGEPMFEAAKGVGPVLGYVVEATGDSASTTAVVRLTDSGRQLVAGGA